MITRALVTGASGFVGRHLATHLGELGTEVIGAARRERPGDWAWDWQRLDVRDSGKVEAVIRDVRPTVVFHLACADRGAPLEELLEVNVGGTGRLLAAVAQAGSPTRLVIPGSSAEYGLAPVSELPIDEQAAFRPVGAYGVSKCAQSLLALAAARADANVVVTRTFNLVGPGEPATLVCGAFASQIAAREAGTEQGPVAVGNLDSMRDFVDVRDAVRAYVLAAVHGSSGEVYNVCSGTPASISDILRMLIAKARMPIDVLPSTGAVPTDVPVQFGNPSRLVAATGWRPVFTLEQSLEALLMWWRVKLERREATGMTSGD